MPMPPVARSDRYSRCHIDGRKQRGNSMPLIVVRLASRDARSQWQNRLGPVERLHLALFIHTHYNRVIRWVHVQADYVPNFLHKLWVFGKLEVFHTMWL